MKSRFYEIEAREVAEIAANLMNQVLALEDSLEQELPFWEHMAYLIEDDGIVLRDDFFPNNRMLEVEREKSNHEKSWKI